METVAPGKKGRASEKRSRWQKKVAPATKSRTSKKKLRQQKKNSHQQKSRANKKKIAPQVRKCAPKYDAVDTRVWHLQCSVSL